MYKEILVPLDGSGVSESALAPARQLAETLGARIHIIQVSSQTEEFSVLRGAEFGTMGSGYSQQVLDEVLTAQRDRIERYLDDVAESLTSAGLEVVKSIEDGQPADRIVDYAGGIGH